MIYRHKVNYYETDKMGITHHSNYIRYMEEARVAYLAEVGWDYDRIESLGIISPVLSVECQYKKMTTFPETITIDVGVAEFGGVRLKMKYTMKNESDEIVCTATSEHCFLDKSGAPIRMKKDYPEFYQILSDAAKTD